jgi:hypothetical protein
MDGITGSTRFEYRGGSDHETLWDWLQLLVVPLALAGLAFLLNETQGNREQRREDVRATGQQEIAADADRETTLRGYFAQISELMLDRRLLRSNADDDVRKVARTTTLTALRRLDGERRAVVVKFLAEAGLLRAGERTDAPVHLASAELGGAQLSNAFLADTDLSGTDLVAARLYGAMLLRADLRGTDLRRADLRRAVLGDGLGGTVPKGGSGRFVTGPETQHCPTPCSAVLVASDLRSARLRGAILGHVNLLAADLRHADLTGADLTGADLTEAKVDGAVLRGARGVDLHGSRGTPAVMP